MRTSIGTQAIPLDVALQSDGKIVAVGRALMESLDFVAVRYLPDGVLDGSFGGDGIVTTPISAAGARIDVATGVAIQEDDKIVVVGSSFRGANGYDIALTRYLPDGQLDPSFDGDGILVTSLGTGGDHGLAVALQEDGKIVVTGSSDRGPFTGIHLIVVRYLSDGSLDPDFDEDGVVITIVGQASGAQEVAVTEEGKIVVAGSSGLIARYLEDGTLDASFSEDGILVHPIGPEGSATTGMALGADGAISICASAYSDVVADFANARYTAEGIPDPGFDGDGAVITPLSTDWDEPLDVALQPDGKLVTVGYSTIDGLTQLVLLRQTIDGAPDPDFGEAGTVTTPFDEGGLASAVTLQEDGAIVVAGHALGSTIDFVVARYRSGGPCAATPRTDCHTAGLSTVQLKDAPGDASSDQLVWKWSRGQSLERSDFGDPLDETELALCVYTEAGATEAVIPAGAGWRDLGTKGFRYRDPTAAAGGIGEISLRPSTKNNSRVLVKGKGPNLADPALPLAPADPILVLQLVSSTTDACMSSSFAESDVSTNQTGKLKAKARGVISD